MGHSVANKIFAHICTERSPRRTIEANLLDVPAGGHVENSPSSQTAVSLYVEKVSYNSSTTHKSSRPPNNLITTTGMLNSVNYSRGKMSLLLSGNFTVFISKTGYNKKKNLPRSIAILCQGHSETRVPRKNIKKIDYKGMAHSKLI
jgi:hypothetical protein